MSDAKIATLERLVGTPRDGALLRYGLGMEYRRTGDPARAIEHLSRAVELDAGYSAAWSLLGKLLAEAGRKGEAGAAWTRGIEAARRSGDKQAERMMAVFMQRLRKTG